MNPLIFSLPNNLRFEENNLPDKTFNNVVFPEPKHNIKIFKYLFLLNKNNIM